MKSNKLIYNDKHLKQSLCGRLSAFAKTLVFSNTIEIAKRMAKPTILWRLDLLSSLIKVLKTLILTILLATWSCRKVFSMIWFGVMLMSFSGSKVTLLEGYRELFVFVWVSSCEATLPGSWVRWRRLSKLMASRTMGEALKTRARRFWEVGLGRGIDRSSQWCLSGNLGRGPGILE